MSGMKKLVLWVFTVVGIPAVFFLCLEGVLRLSGYGMSYDYFSKIVVQGESLYQENPSFGLQYFPAAQNRTPLKNTFSAQSAPDVLRIFVLGGSAARGFPDPSFGFARLLETMLSDALPDRHVEVINTAMTAINSHVVYDIARAIPKGSADFTIILMGNNEVVGPFGPGTVFQKFSPNLAMIRAGLAVRRSRTGQLVMNTMSKFAPKNGDESEVWRGMQMFVEHKVAANDPRLKGVYSHFRNNLESVIRQSQEGGSRVLLSTMPVNAKDSAPFWSIFTDSGKKRRSWDSLLDQAKHDYRKQDWASVKQQLGDALDVDAGHAELAYIAGTAYLETGEYALGRKHLGRAIDLDALRFRADSTINEIIRTVAREDTGKKMLFVDSHLAFEKDSYPEMPGNRYFHEHVHFNFGGNYLLARLFAESILAQVEDTSEINLPTQRELASRVVYPLERTKNLYAKLKKMVQAPPFASQLTKNELLDFLDVQLATVVSRLDEQGSEIENIMQQLASGKQDWRLRFRLVQRLAREGRESEIKQQLEILLKENPHHLAGRLMLAAMLQSKNEFAAALEQLQMAKHYTRGGARKNALVAIRTAVVEYKNGARSNGIEGLKRVARNENTPVRISFIAYDQLIIYLNEIQQSDELEDTINEMHARGLELVADGVERPWLYKLLAQRFRMTGHDAFAQRWEQMARK